MGRSDGRSVGRSGGRSDGRRTAWARAGGRHELRWLDRREGGATGAQIAHGRRGEGAVIDRETAS